MTILLIIFTVIFAVLTIILTYEVSRVDKKIKKLATENTTLKQAYALEHQLDVLKKPTSTEQIQDISANGKALLQTIAELLKEHDPILKACLNLLLHPGEETDIQEAKKITTPEVVEVFLPQKPFKRTRKPKKRAKPVKTEVVG
jgi:hypothetical protein